MKVRGGDEGVGGGRWRWRRWRKKREEGTALLNAGATESLVYLFSLPIKSRSSSETGGPTYERAVTDLD